MKENIVDKPHSDTFVIEVKSRLNATWQGIVRFPARVQEVPFRSALELLKIMDSALGDEHKE